MITPLVLLAVLAASAGAQDQPALSRADVSARALAAAAGPVRGQRQEPDADSDVEPLEALGNFHEVGPGFYRSAQPNRDGYAQLAKLGVKTILNLKSDAAQERKEAEKYGMKVEQVAMSGFHAPSFDEMDRALDVIAVAPRPLLVHCERGKDRTGFVVASYRVTVQRKDAEEAVQEAYDDGCCFIPFGDLEKYLGDYSAHRRLRR